MTRMLLAKVVLALNLVVLVGCRAELKRDEQSRAPRVTVNTTESSPSRSALSDDTCGLDHFPVSKSTEEILAAAPRNGARPINQMMFAKVAINTEGKVTHLRVLRLAWPKLSNSYAINEQAVDSIKSWHYRPTIIGGKPQAACSEVSVTVDLE